MKESDHLKDTGLYGMIAGKYIFMYWDRRIEIGFIWHRICDRDGRALFNTMMIIRIQTGMY
jgi:hypothetical protein